MNSIASIEACLQSLQDTGVGEIIVVDAASTDGTRAVAGRLAHVVLEDPGIGLGNARNLGISATSKPLILNMGSDNVLPPGQLEVMIEELEEGDYSGVSAQTRIEGDSYPSKGLNAWRRGRFPAGPVSVIGTPTLFRGDLLRAHPYDPQRVFSDDSELCERWAVEFGATFAISEAEVIEIGKTSWNEVNGRCQMYGTSDAEIYRWESENWPIFRKTISLLHPLRSDLMTPMRNLERKEAMVALPFLMMFTARRYVAWLRASQRAGKGTL